VVVNRLISKGFLSSIIKWFSQMGKNIISSPQLPDDYRQRQDKITGIKQALEDGTYRVDNRILADSLLVDLLWEKMERQRLLAEIMPQPRPPR
jgi:hypothetical protein